MEDDLESDFPEWVGQTGNYQNDATGAPDGNTSDNTSIHPASLGDNANQMTAR